MSLSDVLIQVWKATLVDGLSEVEVGGTRFRVGRTRGKGLLCITFSYEGTPIDGIEQNPETKSRWAKMAQEGKRIMQFSAKRRYFANVSEGSLTRYPSWSSLGLPE